MKDKIIQVIVASTGESPGFTGYEMYGLSKSGNLYWKDPHEISKNKIWKIIGRSPEVKENL